MQYVFSTKETTRYRFPTHTNDLIYDRADAVTSEAVIVVLEPGEAPPLHEHPDTEQVFYVLEGRGTLTIGENRDTYPVRPTDIIRIPTHTLHAITAEGGPMRYLAVYCFVGGTPVAEPTWESHVRVLCEQQGWDFDEVKE